MGSLDTRSFMISKSFVFRSIAPCLKDMTIWSAVSILAVISTGRFSKKRGGGDDSRDSCRKKQQHLSGVRYSENIWAVKI